MPVYLDCNATTPIDSEVEKIFLLFIREEFGNAGSRTHEFGARAKQAVQKARDQVAALVKGQREDVIFTSGATESNNLAILGLREHAEKTGRRHIISTAIEHKAVLEPLEFLAEHGFEITRLKPCAGGAVSADQVAAALQPDTILVSVMHVNNETGIIQPLAEIAKALGTHEAFFHTDAAQGFGKLIPELQNPRIDLISISGHKLYAPKGIGALILRRRGYDHPPLTPLCFGGGQERGLRPGTQPVALIAALGKAAEIAGGSVPDRHAGAHAALPADQATGARRLPSIGCGHHRRPNQRPPEHPQRLRPWPRLRSRYACSERIRRHLQRLRLHLPELHCQPRPHRHGPARRPHQRRSQIIVVSSDTGGAVEAGA